MKKKKILLISDDLRQHSGVATISREIVLGTAHKYDWVQIAGALKHPEKGKIFDLKDAINKKLNIDDAYVKLYAVDGYGGPEILREVRQIEKPDAIMIFTDPRFWVWLFQMEREIRNQIPLLYLNIWDDLPYPMYNRSFYESCDCLMAISKQTEQINKSVLGKKHYVTFEDLNKGKKLNTLISYVPHGINSEIFYPIGKDNQDEYAKLILRRKELFRDKKYDFVIYYNNRNIRRKQTTDIFFAYKNFVDSLEESKRDKVCLLLHTEPKDENGTDLLAVKQAICPTYNVVYSFGKIEPEKMNLNYNIADITINIASNEGFGLGTAESIMAGTPIIVNVTGGLQDQCGFVDDSGNPIQFSHEWCSNHDGKYKTHGKWVIPVFPSSRSIQGSIPTPYISDDRVKIEDVVAAMTAWYELSSQQREESGKAGREWMINGQLNSKYMCGEFIKSTDAVFDKWNPIDRYEFVKYEPSFETEHFLTGGFKLNPIERNVIEEMKKSVTI